MDFFGTSIIDTVRSKSQNCFKTKLEFFPIGVVLFDVILQRSLGNYYNNIP